ncbi:MAG: SDR family oxidoreductase [Kofleriaceae bacterium]|nr:SDR family oxidoreductase [Kofleriaceae bacterium]MCB9573374.1 SDR family oxidoreductase [Kofleriaceae bacterium]MCB9575347.1 SDR family oxidoreductase [Kofleriaceae bacterium]
MDAQGILAGQRALVTGAGRGIGRAIAVALAGHGCAVALVARTAAELDDAAAACRAAGAPVATTHVVDLADGGAVDALAAQLVEGGGVDVLINNAGAYSLGNALDGDPDEWTALMAVDVLAPMRLTRRLAPGMVARERGTIVNIGSVAAVEPMKGPGAYAAAKHALRGWSLSCYERLREHGVKVVLVNPAYVATPMTAGVPGIRHDRLLGVDDVTAAAMLALTTSAACCPQEITLRLTRRADA